MTRIRARRLATVGAAIVVTLTCSTAADAQERVRWKMQRRKEYKPWSDAPYQTD